VQFIKFKYCLWKVVKNRARTKNTELHKMNQIYRFISTILLSGFILQSCTSSYDYDYVKQGDQQSFEKLVKKSLVHHQTSDTSGFENTPTSFDANLIKETLSSKASQNNRDHLKYSREFRTMVRRHKVIKYNFNLLFGDIMRGDTNDSTKLNLAQSLKYATQTGAIISDPLLVDALFICKNLNVRHELAHALANIFANSELELKNILIEKVRKNPTELDETTLRIFEESLLKSISFHKRTVNDETIDGLEDLSVHLSSAPEQVRTLQRTKATINQLSSEESSYASYLLQYEAISMINFQ
jgi:hypothetical protein